MEESNSSGIPNDSLTESEDDSSFPCRRRRSLRSEVSSNELWEGFPLNITIPRLKITRRRSSTDPVVQGSNSNEYTCFIQKSPHSTSFPAASPRKQKPPYSYLLKRDELSQPASLLWNSDQRDRPFLDDPNEDINKLEVNILADFNALNDKEKLPFYLRAAIALDMIGDARDNSAAERKKRKKSVNPSPGNADQPPSNSGDRKDTFSSLPTDHQDQFLKYKLARLEQFMNVSEYQQFLLDFVLAFKEAKQAAVKDQSQDGTNDQSSDSISNIARKLLYDKVRHAEKTSLTKTRYQLVALEKHKQKFRQFARKLIRQHSLKMANDGDKHADGRGNGCHGNETALADASWSPTHHLSPASHDNLVDFISGDNNNYLKSPNTVSTESSLNVDAPTVSTDIGECRSGETCSPVSYTTSPGSAFNFQLSYKTPPPNSVFNQKLNSEPAFANEKSVLPKDKSVKNQVATNTLNSTTLKIGSENWMIPMVTNVGWEMGLLKEASQIPELQELEVENVQKWLGRNDVENDFLVDGATSLSPAVRFRDAFYTDSMERVHSADNEFQSNSCCLLNSPSCILSGLVSAETATNME